jgi:hypothetical protein
MNGGWLPVLFTESLYCLLYAPCCRWDQLAFYAPPTGAAKMERIKRVLIATE